MTREIKLANKFARNGYFANILRRKSLWVLWTFLFVFLTTPVLAASGVGFFLNHDQKQCATMFQGDSYVSYIPPKPWQKAEPDSNGMIHTQFGSCSLNEDDIYNTKNVEDCCKKLGYTFIGKIKGTEDVWGATFKLLFMIAFLALYPAIRTGIPAAVVVLIIYLIRKWLKSNSNMQKNIGA